MRYTVTLLGLLALAGCGSPPGVIPGAVAGANLASIAVIGRDVPDALISLATGRDCSVVRLAKEQTYCKPQEPPLAPPVYCTRSIGAVDCWREPPLTMPPRPGVADQVQALTAVQEDYRTRRWPYLW